MSTADIVLWTTSLILACTGIVFGVIASINSSKANRNIENLIRDQLVAEEASKYFYYNLEKISQGNKDVLAIIRQKNKRRISWTKYSSLSAKTRLAPIPKRVEKHLLLTEYADLMKHYADTKARLDSTFYELIGTYDTLVQTTFVEPEKIAELLNYHKALGAEVSAILKEYYVLTKS